MDSHAQRYAFENLESGTIRVTNPKPFAVCDLHRALLMGQGGALCVYSIATQEDYAQHSGTGRFLFCTDVTSDLINYGFPLVTKACKGDKFAEKLLLSSLRYWTGEIDKAELQEVRQIAMVEWRRSKTIPRTSEAAIRACSANPCDVVTAIAVAHGDGYKVDYSPLIERLNKTLSKVGIRE